MDQDDRGALPEQVVRDALSVEVDDRHGAARYPVPESQPAATGATDGRRDRHSPAGASACPAEEHSRTRSIRSRFARVIAAAGTAP